MKKFESIDDYIASFELEGQAILRQLRTIINNIVPKQTQETINYNMPTWKYKGNLIHIALYKNHIGVYPGPQAIVHFKESLANYKCSKGAIQIPLNKNIPHKLLEELITYNISLLDSKS